MKRFHITTITSLLATGLLILSGFMPAQAAKQTVVPLLTCPFGCSVVRREAELAAQMARDGSNILVAGQETPGFAYNLRFLQSSPGRWRDTAIQTDDFTLAVANHGGEKLTKVAFPKAIPTHGNYKLLWSTWVDMAGKFFVTLNPKLKTISDLKGHKIAIGLTKQTDFGLFPQLVLEQYGINRSNTKIRRVPPSGAVRELLSGNVDAALVAINTGVKHKLLPVTAAYQHLVAASRSSGRKIYYIGVPASAVKKINKRWNVNVTSLVLPKASIPDLSSDLTVAADRNYVAVRKEFPNQVAYNLVLAVAKAGPTLRKEGGSWAMWSPAQMVNGLTNENVLPGAKKAYEKLGWWKLRKETQPAKF